MEQLGRGSSLKGGGAMAIFSFQDVLLFAMLVLAVLTFTNKK